MKRTLVGAIERSAGQGGVTRRPNPKRRGERSSRTQRTTTRWKASWSLRKRSPSREAWERRSWPARQAKHHCLSKGAAACGAAEETPVLSQQRVGDKGCPAGISRRGAHAMREPFTQLRRPRKVPAASLAGSRKMGLARVLRSRQDLSSSLRNDRLFGDGCSANARERQAPRGARRSDAGEDIGARGCARMSNLVCRSR